MTESCLSTKTLWSIIDPTEILCTKWTCRKILFWSLYACIAAGAVLAELYWGWVDYFVKFVRAEILPLGVVLYLVEPFMVFLSVITVGAYPLPPKKPSRRPKVVNGKRKFVPVNNRALRRKANKELAVVIACHNSRDIIPNTVKACLNHVKPQQIYIVDNGNNGEPTDDSEQVLRQCSPKSHYIWNPYGNKSLAQYAGVMACKKYKYVLVLDDDVILPEELDMGLDLIDGNTVGVVFPIRACHPKRKYSLFVEWQSLEYQLTGYNKLMQHKSGTVQYPHGAASLWERRILKRALRSHDTVFYGEDAKLGIWAMKNGYELKMKPEVLIYTETPTTLLGPMPNYYTQRVRSWDMALHCYTWQYIQVFLCTRHSSLLGTLLMKLTQFYTLFSIFADWLRLPVLVFSIGITRFYIAFALYLALGVIMLCFWNMVAYCRRSDLRLSSLCLATFPLYACLVMVTRFLGMLRAFFVYLPNYQRPPKIPEIEDDVIEAWNATGVDKDDGSEGSTCSSDDLPPDIREPAWLTGEEFSIENSTIGSLSRGEDGLVSIASMLGAHQKNPFPCRDKHVVDKSSTHRKQRSSHGYPMPCDIESQVHQDPPGVSHSDKIRGREIDHGHPMPSDLSPPGLRDGNKIEKSTSGKALRSGRDSWKPSDSATSRVQNSSMIDKSSRSSERRRDSRYPLPYDLKEQHVQEQHRSKKSEAGVEPRSSSPYPTPCDLAERRIQERQHKMDSKSRFSAREVFSGCSFPVACSVDSQGIEVAHTIDKRSGSSKGKSSQKPFASEPQRSQSRHLADKSNRSSDARSDGVYLKPSILGLHHISSDERAADSVQRWVKSVKDNRRVRFARSESPTSFYDSDSVSTDESEDIFSV